MRGLGVKSTHSRSFTSGINTLLPRLILLSPFELPPSPTFTSSHTLPVLPNIIQSTEGILLLNRTFTQKDNPRAKMSLQNDVRHPSISMWSNLTSADF